jgi:hypothetical protein
MSQLCPGGHRESFVWNAHAPERHVAVTHDGAFARQSFALVH